MPSFVPDAVAALQSYATFAFVDLDIEEDEEENEASRAYGAALRLLALVSCFGWKVGGGYIKQ